MDCHSLQVTPEASRNVTRQEQTPSTQHACNFCLYEAKTVCQLLITSALQGRSAGFLALEAVPVDDIFEASDQVPSVGSISPGSGSCAGAPCPSSPCAWAAALSPPLLGSGPEPLAGRARPPESGR